MKPLHLLLNTFCLAALCVPAWSAPDPTNALGENIDTEPERVAFRAALMLGDSATSDAADLPISTATQAALDTKLPLNGGTLSGDLLLGGNDITGVYQFQSQLADLGVSSSIDGVLRFKNSSNIFIHALSAPTLTDYRSILLPDASGTMALTSDLTPYAPLASPTFTGTVILPSTTSIGTVSATELGYLDNVTSAIQTQLDAKVSLTGNQTIAGDKTFSGQIKGATNTDSTSLSLRLDTGGSGIGTGISHTSSGESINIYSNGVLKMGINVSNTDLRGPYNFNGAGSAAAPSIYFNSDSDTGFYGTTTANTTYYTAGGSHILNFSASGITFAGGGTWNGATISGDQYFPDVVEIADQDTAEPTSAVNVGMADARYRRMITSTLTANSTPVNNSTTLADSGLTVDLEAGETYRIDAFVNIRNGTTAVPGMKWNVIYSGTLSGENLLNHRNTRNDGGTAFINLNASTGASTTLSSQAFTAIHITGMLTTSTSGTLKIQFAQQTADASNTYVAFPSELTAAPR